MNLINQNIRNSSVLFEIFKHQLSQRLSFIPKSIDLTRGSGLILFITALFIFNIKPAFASKVDSQITIEVFDNKSFILNLPSKAKSIFEVKISDKKGVLLLEEKLVPNTLKRKYNLKNLPSGEYIISITHANTTKWQHILLNDGIIETLGENLQTIVNPTVLLKDSILDLNMLCFSDAKIKVQIWDDAGHLLSEEILNSSGPIQKRFNLKLLQSGKYFLNIAMEQGQIDFDYNQTIYWTAN